LPYTFHDEFGYSLLERLWRTWAPRGRRPILGRTTNDRRELTTAVGLTPSGKLYKLYKRYKRYFDGGMDSAEGVTMFEHPEIIVEPLPK
jgi:hypothetical protein